MREVSHARAVRGSTMNSRLPIVRRRSVALVALAITALATGARAQPEGARRDTAPPPPKPVVMTKAPVLLQAVAPDYPPAALAAGKTADMIAMKGDPLKDITELERVQFVMREGIVYRTDGKPIAR
jgi:hypothetical protein